jgi:catechol 2,3-dioxygenase-like lactoylglutathione lyase family enzyme
LIRRVHHTSFTVSDMDRSLAFYRDLLGMRLIGDQGGQGGYLAEVVGFPDVDMRVVFLQPTPESTELLELIEYRSPRGTPADVRTCNPGAGHLCLVVEDIHALHHRLREAGVEFASSAPVAILAGRHSGGYTVYSRDPDGVTLELIQLPPHMA